MSDTPKRGMFGRMFGSKSAQAEPEPEQENAPAPAEQEPAPLEGAQTEAQDTQKRGMFGGIFGGKTEATGHEEAQQSTSLGWFQRLRQGMTKTSSRLSEGIGVFAKRKLDDETLEDLEDLLIQADLGVDVAARVTNALRESSYNASISPDEVRDILAREVEKVLVPVVEPLEIDEARKPHVIIMVGVNGTGKTTTIGKYANQFTRQGYKVMLAAGDTFRAAAIEQLKIWGERTGAPVVASEPGADAASLAYDAFQRAKDEGYDVLIIDTAGRLQNKSALMEELQKVIRVIRKVERAAPHSVILTLDATTGQNALSQVEIFDKMASVTGLIMTKLDGTARGGILVGIASKFGIPVHAIGVGEGIEDLQSFDAKDFARAIAGIH